MNPYRNLIIIIGSIFLLMIIIIIEKRRISIKKRISVESKLNPLIGIKTKKIKPPKNPGFIKKFIQKIDNVAYGKYSVQIFLVIIVIISLPFIYQTFFYEMVRNIRDFGRKKDQIIRPLSIDQINQQVSTFPKIYESEFDSIPDALLGKVVLIDFGNMKVHELQNKLPNRLTPENVNEIKTIVYIENIEYLAYYLAPKFEALSSQRMESFSRTVPVYQVNRRVTIISLVDKKIKYQGIVEGVPGPEYDVYFSYKAGKLGIFDSNGRVVSADIILGTKGDITLQTGLSIEGIKSIPDDHETLHFICDKSKWRIR